MSILSGFFKTKKYRKTDSGYKLQSEWTSSETVEMSDGNTLETNLGSIKGITSSLASPSNNYALSASAGKSLQDQVTNKVNLSDIIDNLTSSETKKPLSAAQGKVLKTSLDKKVNAGSSPTFEGIELNATHGGYIDFHYNNSGEDYTSRIISGTDEAGGYRINLMNAGLFVDTGIIRCDSGVHLISKSDNHGVYLSGSATYVMGQSTNSYKPIYASAFSQQSSRRTKENIVPISEKDANKILDLNVVKFDYSNGDKNQCGLIAEDTYKILPNIVLGDVSVPDDDQEGIMKIGIDYTKLVPYLIKKIQMQQKQIDNLQNQIDKLN